MKEKNICSKNIPYLYEDLIIELFHFYVIFSSIYSFKTIINIDTLEPYYIDVIYIIWYNNYRFFFNLYTNILERRIFR